MIVLHQLTRALDRLTCWADNRAYHIERYGFGGGAWTDPMPTLSYPHRVGRNGIVWACCVSNIGPACGHLR